MRVFDLVSGAKIIQPENFNSFLRNPNAPLPCQLQNNENILVRLFVNENDPACDLADDFMDLNNEAHELCEQIGKIPASVAQRRLRDIVVKQHYLIGRYIDQQGIR